MALTFLLLCHMYPSGTPSAQCALSDEATISFSKNKLLAFDTQQTFSVCSVFVYVCIHVPLCVMYVCVCCVHMCVWVLYVLLNV